MHFFLRDLGVETNVTASDKRLMRTGLRMCQAGIRSRYLADIVGFHYMIRSFGMKTIITAADIKNMGNILEQARHRKNGENLGWVIHNMKSFGLGIRPTQKDKAIMRQQLRTYRSDDRKESIMSAGKGIADMHFLMRRLHMPAKVTRVDVLRIKRFQNRWKHLGLEKVRLISAEMNWYLEKLR
jgi:hypothetical protein